jgi:hypothetical protein
MTKIPTIKNNVSKSILAEIPDGNKEKDKKKRKDILKRELLPLNNMFVPNCSLLAKVKIEWKGIKETLHHASQNKKSTIAALNIENVIKNAVFIRMDKPKAGQQTKKFKFDIMFILGANIAEIGNVKLTVGYGTKKGFLYYCITAIKIGDNSHM